MGSKIIGADNKIVHSKILSEIIRRALSRNFKLDQFQFIGDPECLVSIKFGNGIVWKCIQYDESNDNNTNYQSESGLEIMLVKSELVDCDIKKSTYEISFFNLRGELIIKSIETVSPTDILKNL